jgi:hypothetical protein
VRDIGKKISKRSVHADESSEAKKWYMHHEPSSNQGMFSSAEHVPQSLLVDSWWVLKGAIPIWAETHDNVIVRAWIQLTCTTLGGEGQVRLLVKLRIVHPNMEYCPNARQTHVVFSSQINWVRIWSVYYLRYRMLLWSCDTLLSSTFRYWSQLTRTCLRQLVCSMCF